MFTVTITFDNHFFLNKVYILHTPQNVLHVKCFTNVLFIKMGYYRCIFQRIKINK